MVPVRWSVMNCSTLMFWLGAVLLIVGCGPSTEVVADEVSPLANALAGLPGPPVGTDGIIDPNASSDLGDLLKPRSNQCATAITPVAPAPFEPQKTGEVAWVIHARGVGDIHTGEAVPGSVLALEGKTYKALYFDPMKGKDQDALMFSGVFDQEGFRTIRLSKLDLTLRMTLKDRILDLAPGSTIRTAQGTGVGSTLGELIHAHGAYTISHIPEPYECAVLLPGMEGVAFQFKDCDAACANAPVVNVYLHGKFDPDDDEMP
jgi:hypothetical protein